MNRLENLCQPPEYTADMIGDMYKEEAARAIRLNTILDILGDDYDLDRLRELVETDREGRIKILQKPGVNTCGSCGHFHRIAGTSCGTCDEQAYYKSHRGEIDPGRGTFSPSQSRKACRKYNPAAEGEQ